MLYISEGMLPEKQDCSHLQAWGFSCVWVVLCPSAQSNFKDCDFSELGTAAMSVHALIHLLPLLAVLETGTTGTHQWGKPFSSSYWLHLTGKVECPACCMWCFPDICCANYVRSLCFSRNSWFKPWVHSSRGFLDVIQLPWQSVYFAIKAELVTGRTYPCCCSLKVSIVVNKSNSTINESSVNLQSSDYLDLQFFLM